MLKKIRNAIPTKIVLDLIGLLTPLFMAIFAIIPLFFATDYTHFIQVFIVAYFLTIFLIKLIALFLRNKAKEYENEYQGNIVKARIMILSSVIMALEIAGIYSAFMYIIFRQTNKGIFGSSLIFALFYVVFFLVRLIFNLVKIFSRQENKDYYDKTIMYVETITLLYVMVVSLNYTLYALDIRNKVFEVTVASMSLFTMFVICLFMFFRGIYYVRANKRLIRKENRVLKKNLSFIKKENKLREKEQKKQSVDLSKLKAKEEESNV